jgi:hypothetical protein
MQNQFAMNEVFSIKRWGNLVGLHWAGNRKRYLLAIPAIFGLLLVWFSFVLIMDRYDPMAGFMQWATYYAGLYFVGCLYGSTIFAELGDKAQGIAWLAVPASAPEKLLCGLLFSVAAFFIIYTLLFYLVDIPLVWLANRLNVQEHRVWPGGYAVDPTVVFNVFRGVDDQELDRQSHVFLLGYFAVQSAFVLGSVYFSRYAFIKTAVGVLVFILLFMIVQKYILETTLPEGWHRNQLAWERNRGTTELQAIRLPVFLSGILGFAILYGPPLVFWVATYFRLKEKEV